MSILGKFVVRFDPDVTGDASQVNIEREPRRRSKDVAAQAPGYRRSPMGTPSMSVNVWFSPTIPQIKV